MIQARDRFTSAARGMRCSICGSNLRPLNEADRGLGTERAVDTGIFIEFEGEFEMCEHCAIEIGKSVGLVDSVELAARDEALSQALADLRWYEERLAIKEQAVQVLSEELGDAAHRAATAYAQAQEELDFTEVEEPSFAG